MHLQLNRFDQNTQRARSQSSVLQKHNICFLDNVVKNTYITVLISKTVGRYQIKSGHKYLELRASFFLALDSLLLWSIFLWPIFILEVWLPGFKWDTAGPPSDDKSFVKFIHHIIFSNPIIENSRFLIINLIMLCKKVSDIWQFLSGNCSSISFKVEGCPKPIFPGRKKIKSFLALFRHCDPPTRWKSDLQGETDMSAPRKITILQFSTDDLKIKIEF